MADEPITTRDYSASFYGFGTVLKGVQGPPGKDGERGEQGIQGVPGPGPTTSQLNEAASIALALNPPPQGPQGPQGTQGPKGDSATVSVGTVEKGDDPVVTNVGTPSNVILNFTLPKGDQGPQGPQGIQGVPGRDGSTDAQTLQGNPPGAFLKNAGPQTLSGSLTATQLGPIGQLNFPYWGGQTGRNAGWRNDGGNVYLLMSDARSSEADTVAASFNGRRPIVVNLDDGRVTLGSSGELVATGGDMSIGRYIDADHFRTRAGQEAFTPSEAWAGTGDGYARRVPISSFYQWLRDNPIDMSMGGGAKRFPSSGNTSDSGAVSTLVAYSANPASGGAHVGFVRDGFYGLRMGLDADNFFRIGGWSAGAEQIAISPGGAFYSRAGLAAHSGDVSAEQGNVIGNEVYARSWLRNQNAGVGWYNDPIGRGLRHTQSGLEASYGHVEVFGSGMNGWDGYAIRNNLILMDNNNDMRGLYSPNHGGWLVSWNNNADATFAQNVTAYSDERLKQNIRPIEGSWGILKGLVGIRYERDGRTRVGVGAQTTQRVLPEVVHTQDDLTKTLSVNYGDMIGPVIEALKEAMARIETLEKEINDHRVSRSFARSVFQRRHREVAGGR